MASDSPTQTYFTRQVQRLLSRIYGYSSQKDSLLQRAISFYEHQDLDAANEVSSESEIEQLRLERSERYSHLKSVCLEIIELSEGETFEESNRKSAQLLGTIQLLSPVEGNKVVANNELCKPLYKAILCLRLLDRLILDGQIIEPYVKRFVENLSTEQFIEFSRLDNKAYQNFVEQIKIPILMAALLQDIGHYHPQAQIVLCGKDGKQSLSSVIDLDRRKKLLQINYRETIRYLSDGIGSPIFIGNTKAERDLFNQVEQKKLTFIKHLLKSSINPKKSIGNLLKIPQIYSSIIFSTKDSYNYKLLPKVYQVLNRNAEIGTCSQTVVDALYKITGIFPQGFGVVYMPLDDSGVHGDCYEYGIVNSLYPDKPDQPICRMATRKLAFIGYGQNVVISQESNLYYAKTAKKLARLSKERLNEILELLSSNFHERKELDLLPRCWHANEYFSVKANQKLWTKVD